MDGGPNRTSRVDAILRRRDALRTDRAPWEAAWQELARHVRPLRASITAQPQAGKKGDLAQLYDGTAAQAANNLAAGLYGMITNPANEWFTLRHQIEDLNKVHTVKLWLSEVERSMRQALLAGGLRFYSRVPGFYADMVGLGTGVFYTDEDIERGMWFSHRHLRECLLAEDAREDIDTVYRVFTWTTYQAWQQWGERAGPDVRKAHEKGELDRRFCFIHAVEPNPDFDPRRADAAAKRWRSVYVCEQGRHEISVGGYDEFPFQVARWQRSESGVYGEGPGTLALADAKMLNQMSKTTLIGAQKAVDPPLLAPDEYAVRGLRTSPGGITYGGVDSQGNQLVRPLQTGARVDIGLEMEEQRRGAIRDAFHATLLMMVGQPNRTATEVLEVQEEKLRLMAPHLGMVQSEFLDPLLVRVFGILNRAGQLPQPPEVLMQYPGLRVEYVSPLARAAKTAEGASVVRTLEALAPLGQAKPEIWDNFDGDEIARGVGEAYGMPVRMLVDPKRVAEQRQARAAAQQRQMALAAMEPAARAARDLSQAGAA